MFLVIFSQDYAWKKPTSCTNQLRLSLRTQKYEFDLKQRSRSWNSRVSMNFDKRFFSRKLWYFCKWKVARMVDYTLVNNVVKIRMTLDQFQGQKSKKHWCAVWKLRITTFLKTLWAINIPTWHIIKLYHKPIFFMKFWMTLSQGQGHREHLNRK